jgi:hypothetical protein
MQILSQAGLRDAVSTRGLSTTIMRHCASLCRFITLIFLALWALSAVCPASEAAPSASVLSGAHASFDQGGAIADLDGDGRLDLAIVRSEGRNVKGFSYRVELQLSAHLGASSFRLSAPQGGLHIVPRDVNGDGELDLVITSAWSHAPVSVWINDGHGAFTESDAAAYPTSIWIEGPGILSNTPHETFQAAVVESHRFFIDLSIDSYLIHNHSLDYLRLPLTVSRPALITASRLRSRAPPSTFLQ